MLLFLFIDLDICDLGKSGNCPIYTYKSTYVDLYVYMYMGRSPLLPDGHLEFNGGTKAQKSIKNGGSTFRTLIKISCGPRANFAKNRSPTFR